MDAFVEAKLVEFVKAQTGEIEIRLNEWVLVKEMQEQPDRPAVCVKRYWQQKRKR